MKSFFQPHLFRQSIAVRILVLIVFLVAPLNIISILSSMELYSRYAVQVEMGLKNINDVYMNTIDFQTEKADLYLYELLNNQEECAVLKKQETSSFEYENAKYRCYNILSEQISREEMLAGFFLIPKKTGDCIMALSSSISGISVELREYFSGMTECDNRWHIVQIGEETLLVRAASEKNLYYGAILYLDEQQEKIEKQISYDTKHVYFAETMPEKQKKCVHSWTQSGRMELFLCTEVDKRECSRGISLWNRLITAVAFLLILAVPMIYYYMNRLIVKPLKQLNEGFGEIEGGNRHFVIRDEAETVEFQEAFQSFNRMVSSMEDLRLDNMEKELEKNKLELDNLKLQIRPHFLLNTFNLMYCLLRSPEGTGAVRELILYLSDYFRYLFLSDRNVELFDKEMAMIEGYIKVAQIRYPGGLTISYEIEPEVRLIRIPPLLIHNFVENVVKHALSAGSCVHVLLAGKYENGYVQFEISDDGNGMSEEMVKKINNRMWEEKETTHMGVRNAIRRLEFLYGKNASVRVSSKIGEGTTFLIAFPYELEVEE